MLVLGDSIAAGYGLPNRDQGWVQLLGDKLRPYGWQVVNAGVSGDTTSDGLRRVDGLLRQHRPAFVIVELGGNDALRGVPLRVIAANLEQILQRVRASGGTAMLIGVTLPPNYGRRHARRFERMFADLAEDLKVPFLSFAHTRVGTDPSYLQMDRIHPNAAAQPVLAEALWDRLVPILFAQ